MTGKIENTFHRREHRDQRERKTVIRFNSLICISSVLSVLSVVNLFDG